MNTAKVAVSALVAISLSAAAYAQTPSGVNHLGTGTTGAGTTGTGTTGTGNHGTKSGALRPVDQKFVTDAANTNLLEIKLGQLAQQKAQSAEVKSFAQRMVTDHGNAQNALQAIAQRIGATIPTDIDAPGRAKYDKLSKLSGRQFDMTYMEEMVKGHTKTAKKMRQEESKLHNADLKNWDTSTLPTVQQHARLAQSTDHTIRTATTSGTHGNKHSGGASSHY